MSDRPDKASGDGVELPKAQSDALGQSNTSEPKTSARTAYHHGDLREALIEATLQLVEEHGAENFSLADACRRANVSSAAPYKHFRDRDEILGLIMCKAFDEMSQTATQEVERHGIGTLESIHALGRTYVGFAIARPHLFRLMFGQKPEIKQEEWVQQESRRCFGEVIRQVELYCQANGFQADARIVATRLWTFVHGIASLTIDRDYAMTVPDLDIDAMMIETAPMLLPGIPQPDYGSKS